MNTPYFEIKKEILDRNIADFKNALSEFWPNSRLCYSVKTNSLPWIMQYLISNGISAEVVSGEEYALAKMCGCAGENCVFNGPIKKSDQIAEAVTDRAYINLDSKSDLDAIKQLKPSNSRIGIRVNVPIEIFKDCDIGYSEDGFRFGFSDENDEFSSALNLVNEYCGNVRLGLHFHCNSVTRSLDVYRAVSSYAVSLIKKYKLKLAFIDIGGGYFGGVEGKPTPFDYIKTISDVLNEVISFNDTELIVEPGSAIIGSAVDFVTSVVDVKDTKYSRVVTTDGSRINIDPLWSRSRYMYTLGASESNSVEKQIVCGYTCMDHDRIMVLKNEKELSIGDKIIYHRVGAYSMTFGGPFIRYFPDVYVTNNNEIKLVRSRMSTVDYYDIHSEVERNEK